MNEGSRRERSAAQLLAESRAPVGRLHAFVLGIALLAPSMSAQAQRPATQRRWHEHVVRSGESLGQIAQHYRVTVKHLQEWNKIENPDLVKIGTRLKVFAPRAKGSKSKEPRKKQVPAKSSAKRGPKTPKGSAPAKENKASTHPKQSAEASGSSLEDLADTPLPSKPKKTRPTLEKKVTSDSPKRPALEAGPSRATSLPKAKVSLEPAVDPTADFLLHTIPRRPSAAQPRALRFALSAPVLQKSQEEPKSWWQRRRERRRARRARRFAERRRKALAEQGRSEFSPKKPSSRPPRKGLSAPRVTRRTTPNPASRGKAQSVGAPNKGKLARGVRLKSNNWYTVRTPEQAWGSSHALNELHHALVRFRRSSRYRRELVIQAISKKGGGRFPPHKSHQSGRDVDIRLCVSRKVKKNGVPRSVRDVDWDATWVLIRELIRSGQVEYIFLNYDRQRHLYRAARRAGAPKEDLARWIQYPTHSKRQRSGTVRHSNGHRSHIHVRFRCAKYERRCRST